MLRKIRKAAGTAKPDDPYFGTQAKGMNRGRGAKKYKVPLRGNRWRIRSLPALKLDIEKTPSLSLEY
jgi:hypothetical protein